LQVGLKLFQGDIEVPGKWKSVTISRIIAWVYVTGALILILSLSENGYSQEEEYMIKGKVVDDDGRPLSHAGVCVEPMIRTTAFDLFTECVGSAGDGTFRIKKIRNYVTDDRNQELWVYYGTSGLALSDFTPPFYGLQRYDKKFRGVPLTVGRESQIELGSVKVQFWYRDVILDFSRYKASMGLQTLDWDRLSLRIKDEHGHIGDEGGFSHEDIYERPYIDRDHNVLRLSVPEGRWKIEAIWKGKVRASTRYFDVRRSTSPVQAILRAV
jgi:hypothetical protein